MTRQIFKKNWEKKADMKERLGFGPWRGAKILSCTSAMGVTEDSCVELCSFITAASTTFKDNFPLLNSLSPMIQWGLFEKTKSGRDDI